MNPPKRTRRRTEGGTPRRFPTGVGIRRRDYRSACRRRTFRSRLRQEEDRAARTRSACASAHIVARLAKPSA